MHAGLDLLPHVVVGLCDLKLHGTLTILVVHSLLDTAQRLVPLRKFLLAVVPDKIAHLGLLCIAVKGHQVEEALVPFRRLRPLVRQHGLDLHADELGVHQDALGAARVHVHTVDRKVGCGGIEVLELYLALDIPVQRVGIIGAEALHVKVLRSPRDLLVRGKADADLPVGHAFLQDLVHSGQYLGDAGLVVRPQERCTVCCDEGAPLHVLQVGELFDGEHSSTLAQFHILTVIVRNDLGMDVMSRKVHRRVHVGDKADGRLLLTAGSGRDLRIEVTHIVEFHFFNSHVLQLLRKEPAQVKLSLGGRHSLARLVACRPDAHIL